ncbi:unnamed protein product [Brachionus calyciflorus]|uniref:ISXO2-like transposase domain-containing protein n=1 Tax=Brachionus calyciflorus TaxID=104777 RepID=A0A814NA48_9BILA|nr:unnamed protein product [Brachionus calyciflorus]
MDKKFRLGGIGKIVEIDESLVSKVKYNRGKGLKKKQIWMFGLVERCPNGRCYIEIVPDRKAETLLRIIYDRVEEGTTIISDSWSSYEKLKDLNFSHLKVNHKYNFIDPISGAHTNKIEGLWKHAKESFKQSNGCLRIHIKSFLDEFLWRQMVAKTRVDSYDKIITEIAKYYPADCQDILSLNNANEESFILCDDEIDYGDKDGTWSEDVEEQMVDLSQTILCHEKEDNDLNISIYNYDDEIIIYSQLDCLFNFLENNNKRFEFSDLKKEQRALIHRKCSEKGIFHWTEGNKIYVSNLDLDNRYYETYTKTRTIQAGMNDKISDINEKLSNKELNGVKRKLLETEKASYENPKPSKMAVLEVAKVLEKPCVVKGVQCSIYISSPLVTKLRSNKNYKAMDSNLTKQIKKRKEKVVNDFHNLVEEICTDVRTNSLDLIGEEDIFANFLFDDDGVEYIDDVRVIKTVERKRELLQSKEKIKKLAIALNEAQRNIIRELMQFATLKLVTDLMPNA